MTVVFTAMNSLACRNTCKQITSAISLLKRYIGIPVLEDKIVQRAAAAILNVISDVNFYEFSHAYRKGHSQHKALHELREKCRKQNVGWLTSADIEGLFGNIDHKLLRNLIKRGVNDGGIRRLVGEWLNAGVMEEGALSISV